LGSASAIRDLLVQGSEVIGHWSLVIGGALNFWKSFGDGGLVLLEVVGWAEVGASGRLGEALNKFDFLARVSGNFDGLQVVVGMLQLARRGAVTRAGSAEFGTRSSPNMHIAICAKNRAIFWKIFVKREMAGIYTCAEALRGGAAVAARRFSFFRL
jgi:hypothetical protein